MGHYQRVHLHFPMIFLYLLSPLDLHGEYWHNRQQWWVKAQQWWEQLCAVAAKPLLVDG